jgi:hypothetical protein
MGVVHDIDWPAGFQRLTSGKGITGSLSTVSCIDSLSGDSQGTNARAIDSSPSGVDLQVIRPKWPIVNVGGRVDLSSVKVICPLARLEQHPGIQLRGDEAPLTEQVEEIATLLFPPRTISRQGLWPSSAYGTSRTSH